MQKLLMYAAVAGSSFVISACASTLTPSSQEFDSTTIANTILLGMQQAYPSRPLQAADVR
jgi:hypothetical protein